MDNLKQKHDEIQEAIFDLIRAVKLVIPTQENCPLKKAFDHLAELTDEADAIIFKRNTENRSFRG